MSNTGVPLQAVVLEYDGFSGKVQVQLDMPGSVRHLAFETRPFFGDRVPRIAERLELQVTDLFLPAPAVTGAQFR